MSKSVIHNDINNINLITTNLNVLNNSSTNLNVLNNSSTNLAATGITTNGLSVNNASYAFITGQTSQSIPNTTWTQLSSGSGNYWNSGTVVTNNIIYNTSGYFINFFY